MKIRMMSVCYTTIQTMTVPDLFLPVSPFDNWLACDSPRFAEESCQALWTN